jgi:hypothetical protein
MGERLETLSSEEVKPTRAVSFGQLSKNEIDIENGNEGITLSDILNNLW